MNDQATIDDLCVPAYSLVGDKLKPCCPRCGSKVEIQPERDIVYVCDNCGQKIVTSLISGKENEG